MARRTGRTTTTIGVSGRGRARDKVCKGGAAVRGTPIPFHLLNELDAPADCAVKTNEPFGVSELQQGGTVSDIGLARRSPTQSVHSAAELLLSHRTDPVLVREALRTIDKNLRPAVAGVDGEATGVADHAASALARLVRDVDTEDAEKGQALGLLLDIVGYTAKRSAQAFESDAIQSGLAYSRLVALLAVRGSVLEQRAVAAWQQFLDRLEVRNRKWAQNAAEEAVWKIEGAANPFYKGHIPGVQPGSLIEKTARGEFERLRVQVDDAVRNPKNVVRFPIEVV